jgi:DNA mismatch repair protein MSH6
LERQDAIAEIKGTVADFDFAIKFQKELARIPDMERLLTRLYSSSGASRMNVDRVATYEDEQKVAP